VDETVKIIVSMIASLATSVLLWPPLSQYNYWNQLSELIGESGSLASVIILVILLAGIFGYVVDAEPKHIILGSIATYILLMITIEVTISTTSPTHFLLYGAMIIVWSVSSILSSEYVN